MEQKLIYNPNSTETLSQRRTIAGNPDGMLNFTKARYEWALKLWDTMEANTWFPKETNMTPDRKDYANLLPEEKRMYDLVLSQLIFMDSLQTNNLMDNMNPYITAPEINALLSRQAYEEANHSKSYAVMVESISDNTDLIYNMWKTDEKLRIKNTLVADMFKRGFPDHFSDNQKLVLGMVGNQILEGLYFYAGFAAMYALGKSGKMLGSADMIKFIQRDEVTHLLLFQNLINSTRDERPELFTPELERHIRHMFTEAVHLEADWGAYITQGRILGFTNQIITQYIQFLADRRLQAIGYAPQYNVKHPIPWVDAYASFNEQRSNFFETTVKNYSKGSISFDDF